MNFVQNIKKLNSVTLNENLAHWHFASWTMEVISGKLIILLDFRIFSVNSRSIIFLLSSKIVVNEPQNIVHYHGTPEAPNSNTKLFVTCCFH